MHEKPVSSLLEKVENRSQDSVLKTVQNYKRVHNTPVVEQSANSFLEQKTEQFLEQNKTVQKVDEKTILTTPQEDVEKWKHRTKIYFKRAIKKTSKEETKKANKERYMEYKKLLESTGKFLIKECKNRIEISEK